jgi:hypothetical protein
LKRLHACGFIAYVLGDRSLTVAASALCDVIIAVAEFMVSVASSRLLAYRYINTFCHNTEGTWVMLSLSQPPMQ